MMPRNDFLIFIATYNELENVDKLYDQIKRLNLKADILFLDDNSPDGTGRAIDNITQKDTGVFAIHREKKSGIGSAHQEGIRWAYEKKYRFLITMDCDFSHSPIYLADLMKRAPGHDVVIGSRFLQKESLREWSWIRKKLTNLGHFLTDNLLKMPYDASGAFRCYSLERIPSGIFGLAQSNGYAFFFESLYALHVNHCSIAEFPIDLPARAYGHSKMRLNDIGEGVGQLLCTYLKSRIRRNAYMKIG